MTNENCFHCGLPVAESTHFQAEIDQQERHFCCLGCQSVCQMIYDSGMQGFYQRTPEGQLLAPPPEPPKDLKLYDIDEVQEEYVGELGECRDIHLLVEGIHCAACVWLIEHSLENDDGIESVRVNLSARRLHLRWQNSRIKLSQIIHRLGQIGYAAVPFDPETAEGAIKKHNRSLLLRMAFAGFAMMNLLWVSIALYSGADKGEFKELFQWVGFALATPTLLYSGWPFLKSAWSGLKQFHATMDLPISIGAITTYGYSVFVLLYPHPGAEVYFDTVVNFIFVILVGRFLEAKSKRHAVAATQRLLDLQPRVATVLRDNSQQIVPIRSVKKGELVLIKAGEKIPVDGVITEGRSAVDESMLSGESAPVKKHPGDHVSAGTLNIESSLQVKVEQTLRQTSLGKIINLVEEAQASKAPIQCIADQIVPWFVSLTLLLAAITFIIWYQDGIELALLAATSVLIITCPCAFGLATPMAIAVASGLGARHGILIKNGAVLEHLSAIRHFVFDKTGTLTEGKMQLHSIHTTGMDQTELLALAAQLEQFSEHSIGRAIVDAAKKASIPLDPQQVKNISTQAGLGISGDVGRQHIVIGSRRYLDALHIQADPKLNAIAEDLQAKGISCIHLAIEQQECGIIALADILRPDAKQLIQNLRRMGIKLTLLSGDKRTVAEAIAQELGGMEVIAEVMPADKDQVIKQLQTGGEKVAMVGDGVNDAPALIRADVGIAIGSGTDVSMESADIVLLNNELDKLRLAIALSQRTLRTIRQNIGLSILYNIIMVPMAMMAMISPLIAAVAMPISSLAVIGNAGRIRSLFKNRD